MYEFIQTETGWLVHWGPLQPKAMIRPAVGETGNATGQTVCVIVTEPQPNPRLADLAVGEQKA